MPAPPLPADPEVRRLAHEILEGRDYARYRIDEEAWRAFAAQIERLLEELLQGLLQLRIESPVLYWLLTLGLLALALALLAHVAWSIRRALTASGRQEPSAAGRPARDLVREAEALARAGRFLEAARRVEHACLGLLLARGALELGRADCNRVLRQRLASTPLPDLQRRELLVLLDRLEARLFRDPEDDPELYRRWRRLYGALGGEVQLA